MEKGSDSDDELVRELLDDESPFFLLSQGTVNSGEDVVNKQLVSNVCSGPRIQDIEDALSVSNRKDGSQAQEQTRKLGKIENKYTPKIKSCGNGMADDGYKWRKYGQKAIKNSPYPRSYYKCRNPGCSAKKQVEKWRDEPDTLIITYQGLHLHPYSPFQDNNAATKKPNNATPNTINSTEPLLPSPCPQEVALDAGFGQRGLLEDVVPWIIRNPSHNTVTF